MPIKKSNAETVMGNLLLAVNRLQKCKEFSLLMPEVRVNVAYAMAGAKTGREVAAIDGRITVVNGYPHASGMPQWGASDHMARLIIEARKYNPSINAGINFKCDKGIITVVKSYARLRKLPYGWIDRTKEPAEASDIDGMSIPWKVKYLVQQFGRVPVLFYEGDGWGKEPLFFALGEDAVGVVKTAIEIAGRYKKTCSGK
ncbi:MAG: thiamine-phosphate synthase family protein [Dehalococcoidia bacterium]